LRGSLCGRFLYRGCAFYASWSIVN
jgi:hypothetical protein